MDDLSQESTPNTRPMPLKKPQVDGRGSKCMFAATHIYLGKRCLGGSTGQKYCHHPRSEPEMGMNPTQLTVRELRRRGWPLVEVVEHYDHFTRRRHDLFGFVDVIAVGPSGVLAVQTTTASNVASRIRKIADHPNVGAVRDAGIAIHVHGWVQKNGPGTRWTLHRDEDIS